jgi:hypothetical protein
MERPARLMASADTEEPKRDVHALGGIRTQDGSVQAIKAYSV